MTVDMPYGTVTLTTKEKASDFIRNHCQNCYKNNEASPCSGATAAKCNEQVELVLAYFSDSRTSMKRGFKND